MHHLILRPFTRALSLRLAALAKKDVKAPPSVKDAIMDGQPAEGDTEQADEPMGDTEPADEGH
jgi:hypothetical protein